MHTADERGLKGTSKYWAAPSFLRKKGYHCFFWLGKACLVIQGGVCCLNRAQTSSGAKGGLCVVTGTSRDETQHQVCWGLQGQIYIPDMAQGGHCKHICLFLGTLIETKSILKAITGSSVLWILWFWELQTKRQQHQKKADQTWADFPFTLMPPVRRAIIFVIWVYGLWRNGVC